jgi:four helix bundle protein
MSENYENLDAWKESLELSIMVHEITEYFPPKEEHRLIDQVIRSVNSVSSNISEGSGLGTNKQFIRHLKIARGSLFETKSLMTIAHRLNYLNDSDENDFKKQSNLVGKLINGLINYLKD